MVFFIAKGKADKSGISQKPYRHWGNKFENICSQLPSDQYNGNKKDKAPIKIHAGKIQINKVKTASGTPPLL